MCIQARAALRGLQAGGGRSCSVELHNERTGGLGCEGQVHVAVWLYLPLFDVPMQPFGDEVWGITTGGKAGCQGDDARVGLQELLLCGVRVGFGVQPELQAVQQVRVFIGMQCKKAFLLHDGFSQMADARFDVVYFGDVLAQRG